MTMIHVDSIDESVPSTSESGGKTETPSANHTTPATTADACCRMSRSSSVSSSSSEGDFFQFDVSHLEEAAGRDRNADSPVPESCTNQQLLVSDENVSRPQDLGGETSKIGNDAQRRKTEEDRLDLSATCRSEDHRPNASSDPSVSPCRSNRNNRISKGTINEDEVELMFEEIDVPSEMTFKGNHSALDYSYVSKTETTSSYMGFAKQSVMCLSNGKADAYDPGRIPASIFSKPTNAMEWSVASNDSTYCQERQQRTGNHPMSVPHTNSMPRPPDLNNNGSFAFQTLGPDGRRLSAKANEGEPNTTPQNPVDANVDQGSWFSCSCFPRSFCSG